MNNSAESPRDLTKMTTPMTQNQRSIGLDSQLLEHGVRLTKTPQGQNQSPPKFRKIRKPAHMKDTVLIYADLGAKHIRQEALASQIRANHIKMKSAKKTGSGDIEVVDQAAARNTSDMGMMPAAARANSEIA